MMTVDNEPVVSKPKPQPIPLHSSINVGETPFEKLAGNEASKCVRKDDLQGWKGPPPHVRKFIKRKLKRGCCCLMILMLLNLFVACYIAKKVNYVSYVLSPMSEYKYMPGGTRPFCSDLCVDMCASDSDYSMDCDVQTCVSSCQTHFEIENETTDDSSYVTNDAIEIESTDMSVENVKEASSDNNNNNYHGRHHSHGRGHSHSDSNDHSGKMQFERSAPVAMDKDRHGLRRPRFAGRK